MYIDSMIENRIKIYHNDADEVKFEIWKRWLNGLDEPPRNFIYFLFRGHHP